MALTFRGFRVIYTHAERQTAKENEEDKTMTINEGMKKYRLPNPTTSEDLEMRFSGMDGKVLNYGDRVLLAGYYYNGKGQPNYYAAVYEHLDDDLSCEGALGLREVSEVSFADEGHAIAWALGRN